MSDEAKKDQEKKPEEADNFGEGKRILIADDEPTSIELLKNLLSKVGFEVMIAQNGKEAWHLMKSDTMPVLVIADVMMPEMDGYTFLKELKKNDESKNIPAIILTQRKNMEDAFLSLGVDEFIPKPIETKSFLEIIKKLSLKAPSNTPAKEETEKPKK